MDIKRSIKDPHSFANSESARVIDIHLELNVNFNRKVLQGRAILTIERKIFSSVQKIILDNYELFIKSVRYFPVESSNEKSWLLPNLTNEYFNLNYDIGLPHFSGTSLIIQLPQTVGFAYEPICKIQIEYETSPNSPALCWLTAAQTADGVYPFLLSNNKLIYARAMFPCQDTPSVKFKYTAKISVPENYRVLMSALLRTSTYDFSRHLVVYDFLQIQPVPSYAVIIAVGSFEVMKLNPRSNIYAESKYIQESFDTFRSNTIERMLQIAESLCGHYFWDRYDVCVLPPSIAHFEIECPCVTFISPVLLRSDHSGISILAKNIAQSWAGNLVTCVNHNHLWLNKSFSIFIYRKIICKLIAHEEIEVFLKRLGIIELNAMIRNYKQTGLLKCLLPNLKGLSPVDTIQYVPYEKGYLFLNHLESILGGSSVFEPFFPSYFHKFAYKSINTKDFIEYLYQYFFNKRKILDNINWNSWFLHTTDTFFIPKMTAWERECMTMTKELINWDEDDWATLPSVLLFPRDFCDIQKLLLLWCLNLYYTRLTERKLKLLSNHYLFDIQNGEIRALWLLLCIKVRWIEKVAAALDIAVQFCSPNLVCPIFKQLYEWAEVRPRAIKAYIDNKEKMLYETQKELSVILHLN